MTEDFYQYFGLLTSDQYFGLLTSDLNPAKALSLDLDQPGKPSEEWRVLSLRALPPLYRAGKTIFQLSA